MGRSSPLDFIEKGGGWWRDLCVIRNVVDNEVTDSASDEDENDTYMLGDMLEEFALKDHSSYAQKVSVLTQFVDKD